MDAGLSAKALALKLASIGRKPEDLDAVFLTHEHSDHVAGIGPLARKFRVPVFSTAGTFARIKGSSGILPYWRKMGREDVVDIGDLSVHSYPTPHDAEESVGFIFRHGKRKLGHATDLGSVPDLVREKLMNSDALLVEANHDLELLENGPYPWPLKRRIKSDVGHLSNEACADLLSSIDHRGLQTVVLMHLSDTNNKPEYALAAAQQALKKSPSKTVLARQDHPTPLISIV